MPVLIVGVVGLIALLTGACGGSNSGSTSPSPSPTSSMAAAEGQIKADWQTFFAGTTAAAQKISLLQKGRTFANTIKAQASSAIAQGTTAKVGSVTITSPTTATVTYSIYINGQPALQNQTGQAVLQNGTWKVGSASFRALLQLEQQAGGASPSPSGQ